jgi:hypothetical protein
MNWSYKPRASKRLIFGSAGTRIPIPSFLHGELGESEFIPFHYDEMRDFLSMREDGRLAPPVPLEWLEGELQSRLHGSGSTGGATELSKRWVRSSAPIVVDAPEGFPVERVEHLPPELQTGAFGDYEPL